MDPTLVRQLDTTIMVVGASGPNVERVTHALEVARMRIVRVGSAAVACEKLAAAMPQVVVVAMPPEPSMQEALAERTQAVGAIIVEIDEALEDEAFDDLINELITTAVTRKLARDDVAGTTTSSEPPGATPEEIDEGWD